MKALHFLPQKADLDLSLQVQPAIIKYFVLFVVVLRPSNICGHIAMGTHLWQFALMANL